jgi:ParB-like chromosome segregation protein Spo0J
MQKTWIRNKQQNIKGDGILKKPKIPFKTDKQCEEEIDNIISGRNKALNARIVRTWIKARLTVEPIETIRSNLIREYKQKYGDLQKGKKTIDEIQKEAVKEIKQATGTNLG